MTQKPKARAAGRAVKAWAACPTGGKGAGVLELATMYPFRRDAETDHAMQIRNGDMVVMRVTITPTPRTRRR